MTVVASGVPAGLGEACIDRLMPIAHALMSINAVKGVEIGDGFDVVALRGSQNRDEIAEEGFQSNHAGGILGGDRRRATNRCPYGAGTDVPVLPFQGAPLTALVKKSKMITKGRSESVRSGCARRTEWPRRCWQSY
ncbi:chorismate synthase [Shigella flexneri]